MPERDDSRLTRRRVAAWLMWWKEQKEHDTGKPVSDMEIERLLGLSGGNVFRIRNGERLGFDVFLKIRALVRVSTDRLLDEFPPGKEPKA